MADLVKLRELAEAATPGPWGWAGHDDGCVELRTVGRGGQRIVTAMRGEPCVVTLADEVTVALTYEACDDCRERYAEIGRTGNADLLSDYRCPKEENLATVWLRDPAHGFVLPANAWAVRQQDYRADVARVDHPDARYLAAVSPDVVLALLDELEGALPQRAEEGTP